MKWPGREQIEHGGTKWNWSWLVKVGDLQLGCLYKIADDGRIGHRIGATPMEEANRLALFILTKKNKRDATWPPMNNSEPLIYLGPKMAYGGMNGDQVAVEKVHHFVRPNGKRLYIYGEHIKHIMPFTQG
jgi:hypothetical protein